MFGLALGLAVAVSGVPASLAQDSRVLDCKSAGTTKIEAERQMPQAAGGNSVISVDVPLGSVCVGPESVDGAPVYVRRTIESMAIIEVSTTPFETVLAANQPGSLGRPDQPAGW